MTSGSITIYSDGACSGNPGPGGWAARIRFSPDRIRELGGFVAATTNNRMELFAAIAALRSLTGTAPISMVTDSEYLRKGITEWIHNWKRRNWKTAARRPVLNQDLWQELDRLTTPRVSWHYVRGHGGDPDNERCDEIARAFSRGDQPDLEDTT